jgi:hypothetical protein
VNSELERMWKENIMVRFWNTSSPSISTYNPLWVLAFLDRSFQTFLSFANSLQFLTLRTFRSSHTSSNHLNLGLPSDRLPIGFHSNILLAVL